MLTLLIAMLVILPGLEGRTYTQMPFCVGANEKVCVEELFELRSREFKDSSAFAA